MERSTAAVRLLAGDKEPVRLASTANITSLAGLLTVDGVVASAGDRILVKDQTDATQNGIYTVSEGTWYRAPDSNSSRTLISGMKVAVQEGASQASDVWNLVTDRPDLGDDDIEWELYLSSDMVTRIQNAAADIIATIYALTNAADYGSRAIAAGMPLPSGMTYLRTAGYAVAGDGGGALYKKVVSEPAHAGKFQSADGAWWELVLQGPSVNVKWFGAKCDGVTDDTAAVQEAINATQGGVIELLVPGSCFISSSLSVTKALRVVGRSRQERTFTWTSGTLTVFDVVTDEHVEFIGLSFSGPASASSGSAISLRGNTTHNIGAVVRDCTFYGGWNQFNTISAAHWVVDACEFIDPQKYAIVVQNTTFPDSGDSTIMKSVFSSANASTIHVLQVSSGGLKIIGNKFLACLIAYNLVLTGSSTSTSDLIVVGNSFEGATAAEISLTRASGTQTFKNVVIVGNQISISPIGIALDSNAGWLSGVTISGNQITSNSATGACISWGAGDNFSISGNQLTGPGGGTCAGVSYGTNTSGYIGENQYVNLFAKVTGSSTSVRVGRPVPQSGNVAVTCSTAWGSLYRGTANIVFPVPYDSAPEVNCSPGTVVLNGAVSAYASSVTAAGFTLNVISVTNGGSGQATWDANGVY